MGRLTFPDVRAHRSFLEAVAEFADEGRTGDGSMVGNRPAEYAGAWDTADGFAAYVARETNDQLPDAPRPAGIVPSTNLWWVEGPEDAPVYLGRIAIRHDLTEYLREVGGHIGYDVRRSRRREGHATAMLRATLPVAARLGVDPALVTCDVDNLASRRTIETCGGVLEDERQGKLRYWIPTTPGRGDAAPT